MHAYNTLEFESNQPHIVANILQLLVIKVFEPHRVYDFITPRIGKACMVVR